MTNFYTQLTATFRTYLPLLCIGWIGISPSTLSAQGCGCTNCPQFMPDNFVGDFLISVEGADNPTLGQNGQGVCGVTMNFDHEYLGDLSITLTSPSGQSVTLVGPIGFFGATDGTSWDVSFVPCNDQAFPDPGFANQWHNNQGWGLNNSYSGAYYPSAGCLEDFNSGPVDGTWTLTVVDGQGNDVGNFYDYEIIFCDPSGILCFSCEADAGNLTQPDVSSCQGGPSLVLNLPPTYVAPNAAPPAAEYSYTYIISGPGGVILAYEASPDLTAYDPGVYSVCGLSYYTLQEADIPPPDGSLTVAQLNTQLNGGTPPFCGNITGNCVSVTINAAPPDEEEYIDICSPACYTFYGTSYCQTGVYPRTITNAQGCTYMATLNLTVYPRSFTNLVEFICDGECSTTPGFEGECSAGNYQEIFQNAVGCDSIVTLNLQVLAVNASATANGDLNCNTPTVQITGAGSTSGSGVTYFWTASNGGHIVGSNTNLNISVDEAGDYQLLVCRTVGGAYCCDSTEVSILDNSVPPAVPAAITGPSTICQGDTATFTATIVSEATSYIWTVPPGVSINGNANGNTIQVIWTSNNSGSVCVSSNNACGTSAALCTNISVTPIPVPGSPQGDSTVCAGTQENYIIPTATNAEGYTWTITGGTLISGQDSTNIVVQWGNGASGLVCVSATGACGVSPNVCLPVQINAAPNSPVVTGEAITCPGNAEQYNLSPVTNAVSYTWSLSNGTILSGQGTDSIQVMWSANASSGIVCANASNLCGVSPDSCFNVSLSVPAAGQITHLCNGTNTSFTVSFPISGGTSPYTVIGGSITNGVFTSDSILSGQTYSFQITDANGCVSSNIDGAFNCDCATNAGNMELTLLSACEDQTVTATHLGGETLDADDVTAFVLHSGSGTSLVLPIFAQNTSGTFGFQPGMVYGQTYYISLVAGNNLAGLPNPNDPCLSVAQGQPVIFYQIPVANAGIDQNTCGSTIDLNAVIPPGSSGIWSISSTPAGGVLNINDLQSASATATASGFGLYTLSWTLTQNGCVGTDLVDLQFNDAPVLNNLDRVCDAANENYTVTLTLSGGTAPYSVDGQPIAGNIFVSTPLTNGASYSFVVTDVNGCTMAPVNGAFSCNCATSAGTMSAQPISVCEGQTITAVANGDLILDANDIFSFVLHTGMSTALGQILDQNTTGTFSFNPALMQYGVTYYISRVAANPLAGFPDPLDPCFSVAPGQPVQWLLNPTPNAGPDLSICGQTIDLQAINGNWAGAWSLVSGPGTVAFDNINDPASSTSVSIPGAYIFRWTELNGICAITDDVSVSFNALPTVTLLDEICNGTNTEYEITFSAGNGLAPYTVNGITGTFTGTVFSSDLLPNNASYSFILVDANGCESPVIAGVQNCACSTDAGSMQINPAIFCADQPATAVWNNDATMDANDMVQFILHNSPGSMLGSTIYGTNSQPTFNFGGTLQLGVTYYISAIAGNNMAGNVDLNDLCLSVTPGTPVQWKPLPLAEISGDATLCQGSNTVILFNGSGNFPLTVEYTDGSNLSSLLIPGPQGASISVSPTMTTTFSLVNLMDGTLPACSSTLTDAVTVKVNLPVNAGTADPALEFCAGSGQLVPLFSLLNGADPGGTWTETSSFPTLAGAFNATLGTIQPNALVPGTYTFQYRLTASAPCADDETTVTMIIHPQPVADAGSDKTLNCNVLSVDLGGTGTSAGNYQWRLNGNTLGTDRQFTATEGGTYTLLVSTTEGCSDSDMVVVTDDNEVPQADVVSTRNIRCFGEKNGAVSVDAVISSHPPVLYSLNGGPFVANPLFSGLPAGDYVITLQDAIGCEAETGTLSVKEPPQLIADLGPDLKLQLADSAHLSLQSPILVVNYQSIVWSPLLDSTAAGKPYQNFFPLHSWQVGVTLTDSSGCTAEDRILVQVEKPRNIYIPNVFKPDGELGPVLYVFGGLDVALIESFQIYDRWGEAVHEVRNFLPNDSFTGWDGRFRGDLVNPGVYTYFAEVRFIDGEVIVYKGDITVVR